MALEPTDSPARRPRGQDGGPVFARQSPPPRPSTRRGHVLEADVAGETIQVITSTASRPARTAGLRAEPSRRLGVAHHDRDAAQALVVLIDERASADEVAAVAQIGSEGEMPILELGRLLVRELRCIGPTHEQHERVPIELHAANLDQVLVERDRDRDPPFVHTSAIGTGISGNEVATVSRPS